MIVVNLVLYTHAHTLIYISVNYQIFARARLKAELLLASAVSVFLVNLCRLSMMLVYSAYDSVIEVRFFFPFSISYKIIQWYCTFR